MTEIESLRLQLLEEKLRCDEYMEDNKRFATQYNKVVEAISTYAGNLEKQIVMLRNTIQALFCDPEGNPCFAGSDGDRLIIAEALAATDDLSGCVLCDAEPVAHMYPHDETGRTTFVAMPDSMSERRWYEIPLYRAKEQEK